MRPGPWRRHRTYLTAGLAHASQITVPQELAGARTPTDLVGPCRCIEAFLKIETAKYPVVRVIADCGRSTPSSVLTLSPWQSRTMLCFRGQAGEKGATTCTHARHERERDKTRAWVKITLPPRRPIYVTVYVPIPLYTCPDWLSSQPASQSVNQSVLYRGTTIHQRPHRNGRNCGQSCWHIVCTYSSFISEQSIHPAIYQIGGTFRAKMDTRHDPIYRIPKID